MQTYVDRCKGVAAVERSGHVNAAGYFCDYFLVVCHFDIVIIFVLTFCLATHLSGQMLRSATATAAAAISTHLCACVYSYISTYL